MSMKILTGCILTRRSHIQEPAHFGGEGHFRPFDDFVEITIVHQDRNGRRVTYELQAADINHEFFQDIMDKGGQVSFDLTTGHEERKYDSEDYEADLRGVKK